ncbi:membrane-bound lytic murein transglycosylase B [Colwellia chukchiensis]|uniref:Membrane-bound lytic murein transglycosylase B n=1 Tax=Colwellia chukchiensis TaxID=641665 RepID=A0A1H7Q7N4_9GAMM|nr:lytic murein transglycosylase [Colwellia chukchiensis]SEL44181.1 membrane-bound lytic murein transglycosylase B [Colwellia chukchiensis]
MHSSSIAFSSKPLFRLFRQPLMACITICAFLPLLSQASIADDNFLQCKAKLAERAENAGFSHYITNTVIAGITPIKRVIALDKKQPEFSQSFAQYIKTRVTDYHVRVGQQKLQQHQALFTQLEQTYGIPRQYLVAFWGLETVYGKHKGKMSVLNALATLACDQRRSEFFTLELLNLFTLIDTEQVSVEQLQGSWAGAMGHMQFMPTALLKYAIDADHDGKVDVWQSERDALTTAAHYLQQIGWQSHERWGREVKLPADFAYDKVAFDQYYPLDYFRQLGVRQNNQQPLPSYDIQAELYLPAGHRGPAFLLYPNFNVIMTWNLSKSYALSVGLLADKLVGAPGLTVKPSAKTQSPYSVAEMKTLQQQLNSLGFNAGNADGIWGPKSRHAIRAFQLQHQLIADGYPNRTVFTAVSSAISNKAQQTVTSSE